MVKRNFRRLGKRAYKEWENAEPPQTGLEPIAGNFYGTPSVDPRDCELYPDSPWCGGSPISKKPISAHVSLVRDECNLGIQLDSVFGFIKMPSVQIVYRNPNCQEEPEPEPEITLENPGVRGAEGECWDGSSWYVFSRYNIHVLDRRTNQFVNFPPGHKISESTNFTSEMNLLWYAEAMRDYANETPIYRVDFRPYIRITEWTDNLFGLGIAKKDKNGNIEDLTGLIGGWQRLYLLESLNTNLNNPPTYDHLSSWGLIGIEFKLPPLCPINAPPIPPMSCCPKTRENDELLRLIAKRLGAYDYPVSVPKILTDRNQGTESIENLTRFHSWLGKNLDALCGKYPIEIKIEDSDIDQEGNQEQNVKIPNIAEALAEIVGYLLVLRAESDANLNATIRALTEAGAAKQSAIIALDYAMANAEFLGYKGKQVNHKVPFTFKPGEERLDKMLTNNYVEVKGWENDDSEDIKDILYPLMEMAAAYRIANFRNVGTKATEGALARILKAPSKYKNHIDTALEIAAIKKKNQKPPEQQKDSDLIKVPPDENRFDVFIEDAEKGFTNKNGITNTTDPYDRPFDERPKIREIGDNTAK